MRRPAPALVPVMFLALALAGPAWAAASTSGRGQADAFVLEPQQQQHPAATSLAAGDRLAFDWRVTDPPGAPLYFSQHLHIGAQLLNLSETNSSGEQGALVADRDGLYSLLWENHGPKAVTFAYEYHTERASTSPAANPTPVPVVVALLGLGAAALLRAGRR